MAAVPTRATRLAAVDSVNGFAASQLPEDNMDWFFRAFNSTRIYEAWGDGPGRVRET